MEVFEVFIYLSLPRDFGRSEAFFDVPWFVCCFQANSTIFHRLHFLVLCRTSMSKLLMMMMMNWWRCWFWLCWFYRLSHHKNSTVYNINTNRVVFAYKNVPIDERETKTKKKNICGLSLGKNHLVQILHSSNIERKMEITLTLLPQMNLIVKGYPENFNISITLITTHYLSIALDSTWHPAASHIKYGTHI